MTRLLLRLSEWIYRRVCLDCDGWIRSNNHHGEHARCYHARRLELYHRGVEQWKPLPIPHWVSPCPVCGVAL